MPRKNKSTTMNVVDPQAAALTLTQKDAEAPPMGREVTVVQRVYSKPMSPDEDPAEFEATTDDELEAFDENGADNFSEDLLNFFDADGGDGGYKLRVLQITNAKNGAKFTRGGSIYRGEIPYTPEYLREVQENFGGGLFRLQVVGSREDPNTGRMKFGIIKCKTVTIANPPNLRINPDNPQAGPQPSGMYGAPPIPYMNGPMIPEDRPTAKDNLAEIVAIIGMVDKLRGNAMAPQMTAPPPLDPEVAALTILAKNPDVMERLGAGLSKSLLGAGASDTNEWAEAFKELIRSGQGPEMLRVVVQEIVRPFSDAFNARGHAPAPAQPQAPGAPQPPAMPANNQPPQQPQQPAPAQDPAQAQAQGEQRQALPEEQALWLLMDFCGRKIGPDIAADRLLKYADMLNEQAPQYSIDNYLAAFIEMSPDQALEFVKSQPNGEAITKLEHARQWTADVQAIIKRAFTNEG